MEKNFTLIHLAGCALVGLMLLQSCKDDAQLAEAPPVPNQSFIEEFDTVTVSLAKGWKIINASTPKINPIPSLLWQQGGDVTPWFSAYSTSGSFAGFIGATAELTVALPPGVIPIISNWLVSPVVTMQNGDKISFYTRTRFFDPANDYSNRLQLRINTRNEGLNVGSGITFGDFTEGLVDINPHYENQVKGSPSPTAYPADWTRFEGTITGLNNPVRGRFAFRYYIEDGNAFGWGVGLDKVEYQSVSSK